jgi:pimeloyl-ACP methyl ester carboxylesterase
MDLIKTKSFELATLSRGNRDSQKFAILIPGRLDTKDYANFVSHAEYLANQGFFAVAFDPPGTWESPGNIGLYTTTNYLKAIDELIEYYGDKPTLLLGHSRGAAVAMLASMSNPAVTGIVLLMANYGAPTAPGRDAVEKGFQISHRDLPPGIVATSEQKEFALPIEYWKDGDRYDPVPALRACTKPKLLIYGTHDEFTSPSTVRELYATIPEPKMIKEVNSDHDYRYHPEVIKEVEAEIGRFLEKFSDSF